MTGYFSDFQYDQWTFSGLCRVGVVSHTHIDHDPTLLDLLWVPEEIYVPVFFQQIADMTVTSVKAVKQREGRQITKDCRGWPLGRQAINKILNIDKDEPHHAAWWILRCGGRVAFFIGELDVPEVSVLKEMVKKIQPDILMLPVYSDIQEGMHRTSYPSELRKKVDELANWWADKGNEIWALPHIPIKKPDWATKMAEKLPRK